MQYRASKLNSDLSNISDTNDWSSDIETVLEQIRVNSVILSKEHKTKYLYLKGILRYFRVPVILISSIASVSSVGLQSYIDQQLISAITCLLSLTCGIIGSIELFLAIQTRMENELMASKDYYILSIEIFKVLTLDRDNRSIGGKTFLEASYSTYVKLIENSNIIDNKISDRLAHIDKHSKYILPLNTRNVDTGDGSGDSGDSGGGSGDSGSGDSGGSGSGDSDIEDSSKKKTNSKQTKKLTTSKILNNGNQSPKKYSFFEFGKHNDVLRMSSVDDIIGINLQNKKTDHSPKPERHTKKLANSTMPLINNIPMTLLQPTKIKNNLDNNLETNLLDIKTNLDTNLLDIKTNLTNKLNLDNTPLANTPLDNTFLNNNLNEEFNVGVRSDDLLDLEQIYGINNK